VDTSRISAHFAEYGWSSTIQSDSVVTAQFSLDNADLLVVIQWSEAWLRFSIPHLMPIEEADQTSEIWAKLLKLNYETRLVRFAVSRQEQLGIYADLYLANGDVNFNEFEVTLDALCYFAETAHDQIWKLSQTSVDEKPDA
jgi:hypothetical protein